VNVLYGSATGLAVSGNRSGRCRPPACRERRRPGRTSGGP
jgi:hypothetical protein